MRPRPPPPVPPAVHPVPTVAAADRPHQPAEAFEWRLGAYWLGRIGIVVLLTGLVFLGNFVWTKYIQNFGPWGKLSVYALCGAALGMLGLRLEARSESLRNFGRVLLAGGMALGYYSVYAAHFVERLRDVRSPVLGGVLLLAAAGLLVRFADRRRSQGTAMLTVLLAFYTGAMNPIAGFSLFSNALLCGAALFFLWRRQWTGLTWLSMAGSYAAFGFWRFHQSGVFVWGTGLAPDQFWTSRGFLLAYWLLFSAAFLNRRQAFGRRSAPAALPPTTPPSSPTRLLRCTCCHPGTFWIFPLVFGAVLLGMSRLSARLHEGEHLVEGSLLFQGVASGVLGLGAGLHGWKLSLSLGLAGGLLLRTVPRHLRLLGLGCSLGVALVAVIMGLNAPGPCSAWAWNLLFLAALFLAQAVMVRRWHPDAADGNRAPAIYGFLSFMTLCAWSAQFYSDVLGRLEWSGAVMAGLGLALMAASTPLRMRELLGVSQLWLGLGVFKAMHASMQYLPPHSGVMALVCLAAAGCWRWHCDEPRESRALGEGLWTLVSLCWLHDLLTAHFGEPAWAVVGTVLCVLLVAAGIFVRSPGAFVASVVYQVSAALAATGDFGSRIRLLALLAGAVALAFLHLAPRLQPRLPTGAKGEIPRSGGHVFLRLAVFADAAGLPPVGVRDPARRHGGRLEIHRTRPRRHPVPGGRSRGLAAPCRRRLVRIPRHRIVRAGPVAGGAAAPGQRGGIAAAGRGRAVDEPGPRGARDPLASGLHRADHPGLDRPCPPLDGAGGCVTHRGRRRAGRRGARLRLRGEGAALAHRGAGLFRPRPPARLCAGCLGVRHPGAHPQLPRPRRRPARRRIPLQPPQAAHPGVDARGIGGPGGVRNGDARTGLGRNFRGRFTPGRGGGFKAQRRQEEFRQDEMAGTGGVPFYLPPCLTEDRKGAGNGRPPGTHPV
ncbi:MAG: DUF2339 domain-containing protein [Kiritimatiellia bacterium]